MSPKITLPGSRPLLTGSHLAGSTERPGVVRRAAGTRSPDSYTSQAVVPKKKSLSPLQTLVHPFPKVEIGSYTESTGIYTYNFAALLQVSAELMERGALREIVSTSPNRLQIDASTISYLEDANWNYDFRLSPDDKEGAKKWELRSINIKEKVNKKSIKRILHLEISYSPNKIKKFGYPSLQEIISHLIFILNASEAVKKEQQELPSEELLVPIDALSMNFDEWYSKSDYGRLFKFRHDMLLHKMGPELERVMRADGYNDEDIAFALRELSKKGFSFSLVDTEKIPDGPHKYVDVHKVNSLHGPASLAPFIINAKANIKTIQAFDATLGLKIVARAMALVRISSNNFSDSKEVWNESFLSIKDAPIGLALFKADQNPKYAGSWGPQWFERFIPVLSHMHQLALWYFESKLRRVSNFEKGSMSDLSFPEPTTLPNGSGSVVPVSILTSGNQEYLADLAPISQPLILHRLPPGVTRARRERVRMDGEDMHLYVTDADVGRPVWEVFSELTLGSRSTIPIMTPLIKTVLRMIYTYADIQVDEKKTIIRGEASSKVKSDIAFTVNEMSKWAKLMPELSDQLRSWSRSLRRVVIEILPAEEKTAKITIFPLSDGLQILIQSSKDPSAEAWRFAFLAAFFHHTDQLATQVNLLNKPSLSSTKTSHSVSKQVDEIYNALTHPKSEQLAAANPIWVKSEDLQAKIKYVEALQWFSNQQMSHGLPESLIPTPYDTAQQLAEKRLSFFRRFHTDANSQASTGEIDLELAQMMWKQIRVMHPKL